MEYVGLKSAAAQGERDVTTLALHLAYQRLDELVTAVESARCAVDKNALNEARKVLPAQYPRSFNHAR